MTVYILVYLLITAAPLLYYHINISEKKAKIFTAVTCAVLIIGVLAFRHPSMGTDLGYNEPTGYLNSFYMIDRMSWSSVFQIKYENYETGFVVLTKIIGVFTNDSQVYLAIVAMICVAPIIVAICFLSDDILFSTVIYLGLPLFLLCFSGLRQSVAIGICAVAYIFMEKRKLFFFILTVLFATLFHSSAIYLLLAYPLYRFRTPKLVRYISIAAFPLAYIFRGPIFSLLCRIFGYSGKLSESNAITFFLVLCVIYIFCTLFESEETTGLLNVFFIACLVQSMAGQHMLVLRIGYYFLLVLPILIPKVIKGVFERKSELIVRYGLYAVFLGYGLYQVYTSTWARAYPYHPFWMNLIIVNR